MNRFLNWLTLSTKRMSRVEHKHETGSLIAFHSSGNAVWSSLNVAGYASHAFSRNPVVYRCVRMISEAASSMAFMVRENRIELDEHPVLELLAKPNERQSFPRFLECLYGHLLISGNAYVIKIEVGNEVREIHILDPDKITIVQDEKGWPRAYQYINGSQTTNYDLDEILHLALFNPSDDIKGLSPLSSAHMALDIHNSASSWNKALLDNSARPSGALVYASSAGDNLTDEQFSRLKNELEEGYTGYTKAGRPMLLEGGLDWKAMGYSPRDMDFLQAKNGAAREIALAFGVPPMLLGIPGDNTYSNYQEANKAFWRQTVLPLASKTANDIGNWLSVDLEESLNLVCDTSNVDILATDRDAKWQRLSNAEFLTVNEKREGLGFEPLDDNKLEGLNN